MAVRPKFVNRPAPTATGPQPVTSMEVTREALWLLQALCGVERMPAVLVTRPFTDTGDPAERPWGHPGVEVLREKGLVFGDQVHPQVRLWMETLGAPDVVLAAMIRRGGQNLRLAIARRGEVTVSAIQHEDDLAVEYLGHSATVSSLVDRLLPVCGPQVQPAQFDAVSVPTADLLEALGQVARGEHSAATVFTSLGMDSDQYRVVTMAADHPIMELSMTAMTPDDAGRIEVSRTAATVTDTALGRVLTGPIRSDNGSWWTLITPGTTAAIKSSVSAVLGMVGIREWNDGTPHRR